MPPRFNVCVFQLPGLAVSRAFDETAATYGFGLGALGYAVERSENRLRPDAVNVLFGVNLFCHYTELRFPANVVIVNLEQYRPESEWFTPALLAAYRSNVVWDYSQANIESFRRLGHEHLHWVPVGTEPEMARIAPAAQDIDVLHYGALTPRRAEALRAIEAAGLRVMALGEVYGAERDRYIARARLVLQVRAEPWHRIFEIVRASYLMANGKAIVSEWDEATAVEPDIAAGVRWARYGELAAACAALCADGEARRALEAKARAVMQQRPQSRYLQAAIAALPHTVLPAARGDDRADVDSVPVSPRIARGAGQ
jgi:hypothetical protein